VAHRVLLVLVHTRFALLLCCCCSPTYSVHALTDCKLLYLPIGEPGILLTQFGKHCSSRQPRTIHQVLVWPTVCHRCQAQLGRIRQAAIG